MQVALFATLFALDPSKENIVQWRNCGWFKNKPEFNKALDCLSNHGPSPDIFTHLVVEFIPQGFFPLVIRSIIYEFSSERGWIKSSTPPPALTKHTGYALG